MLKFPERSSDGGERSNRKVTAPMPFRLNRRARSDGRKPALAIAVTAIVMFAATSAGALGIVSYEETPFTQAEIDHNWVVDRSPPSGGYESVTFEGRTNVLEMRVDPDNRNEDSPFYYTEGLLRQTADATALRADVYIDPAWVGQDVRAGLWGVGHDGASARSAYPIVEYHQEDGSAGWRVWDSDGGQWLSHPATTGHGKWATVEIVLDSEPGQFVMSVDGVSATLPVLGSETLGEVIVNMYNFGPGTPAYAMHVSDFAIGHVLPSPVEKDDCRKGGYADFGYTNQGLCIAGIVSNS
ncbi:MAG TPA: hypothetical protein VEB69_00410 [Acidimicrobiia bacterium]|nr:hypothetical protein [Acidimicrobiia bacterium]